MGADQRLHAHGTDQVNEVMIGLPTPAQEAALVAALHDAGWPGSTVCQFSPRESMAELRAMVDNAGTLAGFGCEITLLQRYLTLIEAGYQRLLVKVDNSERATVAGSSPRLRRRAGGPLPNADRR